MRTMLLSILMLCAAYTEVFAKVRLLSLDELVKSSDVIVVAKVESVSHSLVGSRYAQATIMEVWKGTPTNRVWKGAPVTRVEFLASPTWTCDSSTAVKGETVVLFLTKGEKSRSYAIANSGYGRMPVQVVNGKPATKAPVGIRPEDGPFETVPTPDGGSIRTIELELLRGLVTKSAAMKP